MPQKIAVIGAGIIGLTSAIRLLENGFDVTIFARDITTNMASRAAPAHWMPFKAAPEEAILKWAAVSLKVYQSLANKHGVTRKTMVDLNNTNTLPVWSKIVANYQTLKPTELPAHYTCGCSTETCQIDTSIFVDYLQQEVQLRGAKIFQKTFNHLEDVDPAFKIIINCSGVWSKQLVPDENSFPIRGQYLLMKKNPKIEQITFATIDEENYILIVPRTHDIWIGGTTQSHDWNTAINAQTVKQLVYNAQQLEPLLHENDILSAAVGLRPGRKSVRLEAATLADQRTVIHNYGHGGSGFTVSWGCANQVLELCRLV